MSFTRYGHISVKPFAKVPALGDLPEIQPAEGSVSNVSSTRGIDGSVDLAEGCLITNIHINWLIGSMLFATEIQLKL